MKLPLVAAAAAGMANAASLLPGSADITARALPDAPDGYTPKEVACPTTKPTIRDADTLSTHETEWLKVRRRATLAPMKELLDRLDLGDFDASAYIDRHSSNIDNTPNIAVALSGGGYRAMTNGAGALKAFDARTENATATGHLGGLLQSSTYVSGLSGGSWLVGSMFANNFTTISNLQASDRVWDLSKSLLEGPNQHHIQLLSTYDYWKTIIKQVHSKSDAGYKTSFTDYWSRSLSFQLINSTTDDGGASFTWSSIADMDDFKAGQYPMPMVVMDGRNPGEKIIETNATVYEVTPWEFGSWDPTVYAFAPLAYLGTEYANGSVHGDKCVRGYDNAGFIMGSSSTLFNEFLLQIDSKDIPHVLEDVIGTILKGLSVNHEDIAVYSPNPFHGHRESGADEDYARTNALSIVDGGEDNENIPLHPLIQPPRAVDVIFAIDSSADTASSWPNGTSLVATYQRSLEASQMANGTSFPPIPDQTTFVNLGLNNRPTFFGCDPKNLTSSASASIPPLVVYLPNAPYTHASNTSTFKLTYSDEERDAMITNGYNVVTRANGTLDSSSSSTWTSCVACAILQRSTHRTNTSLPAICTTCFEEYCWDGSVNSTVVDGYEPTAYITEESAGSLGRSWPGLYRVMAGMGVGVMVAMGIAW
ncbi:Lysophospholipase [Aspergillus mulundensis]|uniref:Lysophospholipase n=1 Tax=Aspergillus mulundensis TaxID=1810919 RepID=A0A3D8R4G9_9EURO|nr:Lysophospholipase [Aspergillus mulundensis]RDW68877.1 Lysophospholipase [Aspergillus mulundensis]